MTEYASFKNVSTTVFINFVIYIYIYIYIYIHIHIYIVVIRYGKLMKIVQACWC